MTPFDADSPPPEILRSAVMFFGTMGTVFGLGMLWTTCGDDIVQKWNEDVASMKNDWEKATTPDREKQRRMFGFDWRARNSDQQSNFRDVADQLDESDSRRRGYSGDFVTDGSFADETLEL